MFERGLIGGGEGAELADDEGLFERCENRLDGGGLEQPGRLLEHDMFMFARTLNF